MSYLFPQGDLTNLGVLQVGSNINVDANSVISIPQNVSANSNVTFSSINVTSEIVTGNLTLNGSSVITNVSPVAGNGISLSSVTTTGPNAAFTITNTGVLRLTSGTGISLSSNTGNIIISATSASIINTFGANGSYTATANDEYIGVTNTPATITLPTGVTGTTYIIKNENAGGTVTVQGTGGQKLDDSNTKTLNNNASLTVVFRAGQWRII